MKVKQLLLSLVTVFCLVLVPSAGAVGVVDSVCKNADGRPTICDDNSSSSDSNPVFGPDGILTVATRILSILLAIISVLVIIISGLRIVLSNGDANSYGTARKGVIYALAALAVAGLSQVIVSVVLMKL